MFHRNERFSLVVSWLLCFMLIMLVLASLRMADPIVAGRWQGAIEVIFGSIVALIVALSVSVLRTRSRERARIRRYYEQTAEAKPVIPVVSAASHHQEAELSAGMN